MKKREALGVVKKLGFEERKSKELRYNYRFKGKLIATTTIPKGKGDFHVADQFRKQIKLSREQLSDALKCPFGEDDYVKHLKKNDLL